MRPILTKTRVERAIWEAAIRFDVQRWRISGSDRTADASKARQAVILALFQAHETTAVQIGHMLGRDHSTIIYSIEKAEQRCQQDEEYADMVVSIKSALLAASERPTPQKPACRVVGPFQSRQVI